MANLRLSYLNDPHAGSQHARSISSHIALLIRSFAPGSLLALLLLWEPCWSLSSGFFFFVLRNEFMQLRCNTALSPHAGSTRTQSDAAGGDVTEMKAAVSELFNHLQNNSSAAFDIIPSSGILTGDCNNRRCSSAPLSV